MYQSVENQVAKECLIDQLTSAVDGTHSSKSDVFGLVSSSIQVTPNIRMSRISVCLLC